MNEPSMNERGWVVLLVRGIGLAVLGVWGPALVSKAILIAYAMQSSQSAWMGSPGFVEQQLLVATQEVAAVALGLYLLLGGRWVIDRICQQVVGVCPICGEKTGGGPCPECGHVMPRSAGAQPAGITDGERVDADKTP